MSKTSIEWTATQNDDGTTTPGHTWNPIRARNRKTNAVGHYCEKISSGCANCYASNFQKRFKMPEFPGAGKRIELPMLGDRIDVGNNIEVYLDERVLLEPLSWRKPRKAFVCSMTDLFGAWVPDMWIDRVFAVMALARQHTFQVLTKRAERMASYWNDGYRNGRGEHTSMYVYREAMKFANAGLSAIDPDEIVDLVNNLPRNCWLGVSVENQEQADTRIPHLLRTPAAVRFLSVEPLLGAVRLDQCAPYTLNGDDSNPGVINAFNSLCHHPLTAMIYPELTGNSHGISCGGESGHGARPMHPSWVRSLRDQCVAAKVPFFFKQWGEWFPSDQYDYDTGRPSLTGRKEIHVGPAGQVVKTSSTFDHGCPVDVPKGYASMVAVGKHAAGRVLDGRTWDEMPKVEATS